MLAAALLKRPYLITEHSILASPYKNGVYVYCAHLLFNPLRRWLYRRSVKVLTVSEANRDLLREVYRMPADTIAVIHNGIDTATFVRDKEKSRRLREEFNIPEDCKVLVNVGRLSEEKGQHYLVHALESLQTLQASLMLLLVGDGPMRDSIEADVTSGRLSHCVRFMGFREDVADILQLADIFVLPSTLEGFPFTILEAMAAGKAVIATDVGGNREAVLNGVTGMIIEPANVEHLSSAIRSLIDDDEKRIHMGLHGKQRANDLFTKDKMIKSTFAFYE
jgi:glycosyltransferase involved in cell wall biosynthesis